MRFIKTDKNALRIIAVYLFVSFFFSSFQETAKLADDDYINEIRQWQEKRLKNLTADDGWLNLAGLFALQEGENTFGADTANDIVFPKGKAPGEMGSFSLKNGAIFVTVEPNIEVSANGKKVQRMQILTDRDEKPTILEHGSLRWYAIKRGEKFYLRLRDLESAGLKEFHGIESYRIDVKWRIAAVLQKHDSMKTVSIPNILGDTIDWQSPGALHFEIDGKSCRLDALGKLSDPRLFVIFADETNSDETYPAGRFLYVDTPGEDGTTYIDFNKAYNPPCAFTAYATCPLPPKQNHLPVRVTAGEKNYQGGTHGQ